MYNLKAALFYEKNDVHLHEKKIAFFKDRSTLKLTFVAL